MPYRWDTAGAETQLTLWPHRSLTPVGFVWFIGATAVMFALPLFALLGQAELWILLPFLIGAVALIWGFIMKHLNDRQISEILTLSEGVATLTHRKSHDVRSWQANPYWITVTLYATSGPVENYLTLRGNGREVELGAFLSPDERIALFETLKPALPHGRFQHA